MPDATTVASIINALQCFGAIDACMAPEPSISLYRVKFTSHAAAEQVVAKAPKQEGLYDYAFIAFNSRAYDDLDSSGDGRGW